MDGKWNNEFGLEGLKVEFDASAKPVFTVDVERYQTYLDETDMSEAQKAEFLQSLWQVMVSFVELGFGVHPLQEVCGKDAGIGTQSSDAEPDGVVLDDPQDNRDAHGAIHEGSLELE